MRITFVLPMHLSAPSGGFKVVYEYAGRLQARGHRVTVVHPRSIEPASGPFEWARSLLWKRRILLVHGAPAPWFRHAEGVRLLLVRDLREQFIPDGDAIFATALPTSFAVAGYGPAKGRKFYLIQSYENWQGSDADVRSSWNLPMHKVVISKWLLERAVELGVADRTTYITLGLDFSQFNLTRPIEERTEPKIAMLSHPHELKGTKDGLEALEIARLGFPSLRAVLFGTEPRPAGLAGWIEYRRGPSPGELRDIYNSCSIFLHPSHEEGWGLPPAEAMACGCALVSAANRGAEEFAEDGVNALLAPVRQPRELAARIARLLGDDSLRAAIALNGYRSIQKFTWDAAVDRMEALLEAR